MIELNHKKSLTKENIIRYLAYNAGASPVMVARALELPIATVAKQLQRLSAEGTISSPNKGTYAVAEIGRVPVPFEDIEDVNEIPVQSFKTFHSDHDRHILDVVMTAIYSGHPIGNAIRGLVNN